MTFKPGSARNSNFGHGGETNEVGPRSEIIRDARGAPIKAQGAKRRELSEIFVASAFSKLYRRVQFICTIDPFVSSHRVGLG